MSIRQLWEGAADSSWISRLDGRTKLAFLFLYALMMILVDQPRTLFFLFTMTLVLHGAARTGTARWRVLAVFLLLGLWGSVASQALFFAQTPRTAAAVLIPPDFPVLGPFTGGLYIYQEGVIYGAVQGLRSASMLSLGLLICWTSDPRQLLKGLTAWHLSPQAAFMIVTAIRFFPVMAAEAGEVMTALRLRSGSESGRHGVVRHLPYILKPLLARCIRRAQTLSLSVVSRGLFLAERSHTEPWPFREKGGILFLTLGAAGAAAAKFLYELSLQGFYFGNFRLFYDWAKWYL